MTTTHRHVLQWAAIALLAAAPVASAQPTPARGPTQAQKVAEQAGDYLSQVRETVRLMDQNLARALSRTGDPRSQSKRSNENVSRVQIAHRAYLDQRTLVLALVREAERPDPAPGITQERIDTAREALERLYDQAMATAK